MSRVTRKQAASCLDPIRTMLHEVSTGSCLHDGEYYVMRVFAEYVRIHEYLEGILRIFERVEGSRPQCLVNIQCAAASQDELCISSYDSADARHALNRLESRLMKMTRLEVYNLTLDESIRVELIG